MKSLATELQSDALIHEREAPNKVVVLPFTGVGPRMYESHFVRSGDLKNDITGAYKDIQVDELRQTIRLLALGEVEKRAAELSKRSSEN